MSMGVAPECVDCLRRLIRKTVEAASDSPELRARAARKALETMERLRDRAPSPAYVANRFHPVIQEVCGNRDPFAASKVREMETARRLAVRYAPGPGFSLREGLLFSALGNALDFFRPAEEMEPWLENPPPLELDRTGLLEERLAGGKRRVVWLADNAGEVFFDRPAVEELARRGHRVAYAVKGGAVQNDLTLEDFERRGPKGFCCQVASTGAATVGLELDRASPAFRKLFRGADWIVAKGMGHFETLWWQRDPRVFLLLMAKCGPVARALGVAANGLAAGFASGGSVAGTRQEELGSVEEGP